MCRDGHAIARHDGRNYSGIKAEGKINKNVIIGRIPAGRAVRSYCTGLSHEPVSAATTYAINIE